MYREIPFVFFPPPILSHNIEIELGSVLTINNALLALDQEFFFIIVIQW